MPITIPIRTETAASAATPNTRPAAPASAPGSQGTRLTSLPPLSLYVHVPWCVRKCPYCDFNSHAAPAELPERMYLDALRADLEGALPLIWGRQVMTVFIGGGTPSLLSAAAVDELMAMLRSHLNLWPDAEVTLEANPGASEAARFKAYADSGINRLSLGIQTFDDAHLKALGRVHDAHQARVAIHMAQQAVERVNLDVMFALPGQTLEGSARDVQEALSYGCEHLSLYHLSLEPQTVFAKFPPRDLPSDDLADTMQSSIESHLAAAGFDRYEVSAFARAGARSRHNLNYWEFGDYLGIGPGAHGKLSFHDRIIRQARVRNPQRWMSRALEGRGAHIASEQIVSPGELPFEFMLNALRLQQGVPSTEFDARTGLSLATVAHQLEAAVKRGLLDGDPRRIRATPLGWRFLNDLQEMFL